MANTNKKTRKHLGYVQTSGSKEVYQICSVDITSEEIILTTI